MNLALSGPLPPNDMKLYSADDIGIDEARRGCRLEMIKIVREVDEVTENPKVATDPSRNWRYLSPHIFRLLLPIVERKPILSPEDVVKLKEKLQKDIEAAIKAKRDEQAPVLSTSTSPPISSSTVTEQKAEDRQGLEAQIKAKKAELDSFRSKLRSLQSSLSQDDMTKIQVKLREDLMAQIQDKQRQLDSVKMGLEMIANASYVTGLEATIQDKLKADLDKQILIKQQEIGFVEQELKLATREDDLASREKKLEAKLARELALQRTEPNVPDHPSPEKPVNPVPDEMDHAFQPPQYQPEPSVPDTSEQPLSNDWHDSVVWIQNQDTDLVLHLAGDPSHNGSPVVGRPLSLEDKAQEWRIKKILGEESWTLTDVKGGSRFLSPIPRSRGFLGSMCVIHLTTFHSRPRLEQR